MCFLKQQQQQNIRPWNHTPCGKTPPLRRDRRMEWIHFVSLNSLKLNVCKMSAHLVVSKTKPWTRDTSCAGPCPLEGGRAGLPVQVIGLQNPCCKSLCSTASPKEIINDYLFHNNMHCSCEDLLSAYDRGCGL